MPKYFYICENCNIEFDTYHGMNEKITDCTECESKSCLRKVPSSFNCELKQTTSNKKGEVVKKSIEEFKEQLKEEKNKLKSNIYDPNK
jgi:predicted nucleic acid-binding Zn ribbon protein